MKKHLIILIAILLVAGCNETVKSSPVWGTGELTPEYIKFFGKDNTARLNKVQNDLINKHELLFYGQNKKIGEGQTAHTNGVIDILINFEKQIKKLETKILNLERKNVMSLTKEIPKNIPQDAVRFHDKSEGGSGLAFVYQDGLDYCAVREDFVNLQESVVGFDTTPGDAITDLVRGEAKKAAEQEPDESNKSDSSKETGGKPDSAGVGGGSGISQAPAASDEEIPEAPPEEKEWEKKQREAEELAEKG